MQDCSDSVEGDLFETPEDCIVQRVTVVKFGVDNRGSDYVRMF